MKGSGREKTKKILSLLVSAATLIGVAAPVAYAVEAPPSLKLTANEKVAEGVATGKTVTIKAETIPGGKTVQSVSYTARLIDSVGTLTQTQPAPDPEPEEPAPDQPGGDEVDQTGDSNDIDTNDLTDESENPKNPDGNDQSEPGTSALDTAEWQITSKEAGTVIFEVTCRVTFKDQTGLNLVKKLRFEFTGEEQPLLRFGAMSDIHIGYGVLGQPRFLTALSNTKKLMPDYDALLFVGDLTDDGKLDQYAEFKSILNTMGVEQSKWLPAIGNHEFFESARATVTKPVGDDKLYRDRFASEMKTPTGKVYYEKEVNGYAFIVLGSEASRLTYPKIGDSAYLSDEQLTWLEETLKKHEKDGKPIFVALHQPVQDTVAGSETGSIVQNDRLDEILGQYPQVVLFSGHSHNMTEMQNTYSQMEYNVVNLGSLRRIWYAEGWLDDTRSQSMFVDVYKDRIVLKAYDHSTDEWINAKTIQLPYEAQERDTTPPVFEGNGNLTVGENDGPLGDFIFNVPQSKNELYYYTMTVNGRPGAKVYNLPWEEVRYDTMTIRTSALEMGKKNQVVITAYDVYGNASEPIQFSMDVEEVTGFIRFGGDTYYVNPSTKLLATGLQVIDGHTYYFDALGAAQSGWVQLDTKWYYFDDSFQMQTGWVTDTSTGKRYYCYPDDGHMATGWFMVDDFWYFANSNGVLKNGWVKADSLWYYIDPLTYRMQTGWLTLDDRTFYLNEKTGAMKTGWFTVGDTLHYAAGTGVVQTGWQTLNSKTYYFDPDKNGAAVKGWQTIDNSRYYFETSGMMQTGWKKLHNQWYYLGTDGKMQTGWHRVGKKDYFFNSNGVMQTGWLQNGGKWYFLESSGAMKTGWLLDKEKWYYLGTDGQMKTGWYQVGQKWYFSASGGAMKTGWFFNGGKWYFLASSGAMKTGWLQNGGKWYYLGTDGKMKTGWLKNGGKWYYLNDTGKMVADTKMKIGKKRYSFNAKGVCTNP